MEKLCLDCNNPFEVTGRKHFRCRSCSKQRQKRQIADWQDKHRTKNPGVGKGGSTGFEKDNPYFKHGLNVFRRWAKEKLKALSYCCERCGITIDATKRGSWAGHHKDHNRQNNTKDNLEILCKRCHQIEHECWTAFQGVTTIPKGSTLETVEAHSPMAVGDDIV
jgi:hypothetical protein